MGASHSRSPACPPTRAARAPPCRDATSLAHTYDVFAQQLELSVVDNVLLVSAGCIAITDCAGCPVVWRAAAAAAALVSAAATLLPGCPLPDF